MAGIKKPRILLVEDNPIDAQILEHAFSASQVPHQLDIIGDGQTAIDLLTELKDSRTGLPRLIILDLNLPQKGGLELLREIKAQEVLRRIPVIVMSSSRSDRDVNSAYESGASLYVRKPGDLESVEQLAEAIARAWLMYGGGPV